MSAVLTFGTDGVRGPANAGCLTPENVTRLGFAAGMVLRTEHPACTPLVLIGRDTRISGLMLENALAAGLQSAGIDIARLGVIPTPGVAALVRGGNALAGAVISASHNPAGDNGIKFFGPDGYKLSDEIEAAIEQSFVNGTDVGRAEMPGSEREVELPVELYLNHARRAFPQDLNLQGIKLVVDGANGAACVAAPAMFRELQAEVICIACDGDGARINAACGSTHPHALCEAVVREGAAVGVAFDGDADRLLLVDETGSPLDGDELLAIAALDMLKRKKLTDGLLVATVMSNFGLNTLLESQGGRLARTAVGDRNVIHEMRAQNAALGGEQSGHVIFHEHSTTGDGLVSALEILAIVRRSGRPLSELRRVLKKSPQAQRNIALVSRPPLESVPGFSETKAAVECELGAAGRLLVRYSGTETKVRILVEGPDEAIVAAHADRLAACFAKLQR